jgi:hypothetical protein
MVGDASLLKGADHPGERMPCMKIRLAKRCSGNTGCSASLHQHKCRTEQMGFRETRTHDRLKYYQTQQNEDSTWHRDITGLSINMSAAVIAFSTVAALVGLVAGEILGLNGFA